MNTYTSTHSAREAAPKKRNRKKIAVVGGVVATFVIPAAAWAAVNIFGFGSFEQAAAENGTVQILSGENLETSLTPSLAPGQSAGVRIPVRNPNDYPITITDLIIKKGFTLNGGSPAQCKVTVNGEPAVFPANGDQEAVNGSRKVALPEPRVLAPGAQDWFVFPAVFEQSGDATKMCGVKADFAVQAKVGN